MPVPQTKPEENQVLKLCVSYWESRKVRGVMAFFYSAHNKLCDELAEQYRQQIKKANS